MIFRLANQTDEPQIRKLTHETVMPGRIKMIYTRDPSYLESFNQTDGETQIIVADENKSIVAVGCRSISELYVNGKPKTSGYLSGLKVSPSFRNATTLARGYSYLKKLHSDNKTEYYLTTIIQGNDMAEKILTSRRAGLPSYIPYGNYHTYVIPVKVKKSGKQYSDYHIVSCNDVPEIELIEFLNCEGARKQFFPVFRKEKGSNRILDSIGRENVFIALKDGNIVGVMGLWNQEKFKQHIVAGYSRSFRVLAPLVNIGLRLKGCRSLPDTGNQIRYGAASLVCVKDDDPRIFQALVNHSYEKASSEKLDQLVIGMHERDPFRKTVERYFNIEYRSSLYLVSWDNESIDKTFDSRRIPYLELGCL